MSVINNTYSQLNNNYEGLSKPLTINSYSHEHGDGLNSEFKRIYTIPSEVYKYNNNNNQQVSVDCMKTPFTCVQTKPKVFIRRVNIKRKLDNKKSNSLINDATGEVNPNKVYPINSLPTSGVDNFGYTIPQTNELSSEYNENYMYDASSKMQYMNLPNDAEYYTSAPLINFNNEFINDPMCVQESYINNKTRDFVNQVYPMNQHKFTMSNVIPVISPLKQNINMQNLIRIVRLFLQNVIKIVNLTCEKMQVYLHKKEIRVNTTILRSGDVKATNKVYIDNNGNVTNGLEHRDCVSFFEGFHDTNNFFSRICNMITNWLESGNCTNNLESLINQNNIDNIVAKCSNEFKELYYQTDSFPKDDTGKVQLPKF